MIQRDELFEMWAPADGPWSLWAKPVLFSEVPLERLRPLERRPAPARPPAEGAPYRAGAHQAEPDGAENELTGLPDAAEGVALVLDIHGARAVQASISAARRGYRPVPLFNACTGSAEVVAQAPIIEALIACTPELQTIWLPPDAPPAFLLDARRMPPGEPQPKRFDNRWFVFPQDLPSAKMLASRGIQRVLLVQEEHARIQGDIAHVLLRWQEAGIEVLLKIDGVAGSPEPIHIPKPSMYRATWQQVIVLGGLRQNLRGGFGAVVPEPPRAG